MSQATLERLDPKELQPIFAEIEPDRKDIDVIRGLIASLGQERFVRMRQVTPVARIEMGSGNYSTDESRERYFVDFLEPREQRYLKFVTAVWARAGDALELYPAGSKMHHFKPGELEELGRPVVELFDEYDGRTHGHSLNDGRLRKWTNPDIHTVEGMQELAAILNNQGEAVDDQKAG